MFSGDLDTKAWGKQKSKFYGSDNLDKKKKKKKGTSKRKGGEYFVL